MKRYNMNIHACSFNTKSVNWNTIQNLLKSIHLTLEYKKVTIRYKILQKIFMEWMVILTKVCQPDKNAAKKELSENPTHFLS